MCLKKKNMHSMLKGYDMYPTYAISQFLWHESGIHKKTLKRKCLKYDYDESIKMKTNCVMVSSGRTCIERLARMFTVL